MYNQFNALLITIKPGWTITWHKKKKVITLQDENNNPIYWKKTIRKMDANFIENEYDFSDLATMIGNTHGRTAVIRHQTDTAILIEFI